MALPQKIIDQLGREPSATPGWTGQILMFSGTLFFISLVIYFGIDFGYRSYVTSQVKKLKDQVQAFSEQVPVEDQKKIIDFYSQTSNLKTVLSSHIFSSQLLSWLERNSQINVTYDKFNLNIGNNQVILGGSAKTMDDINQQFIVFQSQKEVSKVAIGNINFSGNLWRFEVTLTFAPGYFNRSNTSATSTNNE